MSNEIELGDRVEDTMTGFKGIVTGITDYLQQCRQILVRPERISSDGKRIDPDWIDEAQLKLVKKNVYEPFINRRQVQLGQPATGPDAPPPPESRR